MTGLFPVPCILNSLPLNLRSCLCTTKFKALPKSYFMSQVSRTNFVVSVFFFVVFCFGFGLTASWTPSRVDMCALQVLLLYRCILIAPIQPVSQFVWRYWDARVTCGFPMYMGFIQYPCAISPHIHGLRGSSALKGRYTFGNIKTNINLKTDLVTSIGELLIVYCEKRLPLKSRNFFRKR